MQRLPLGSEPPCPIRCRVGQSWVNNRTTERRPWATLQLAMLFIVPVRVVLHSDFAATLQIGQAHDLRLAIGCAAKPAICDE